MTGFISPLLLDLISRGIAEAIEDHAHALDGGLRLWENERLSLQLPLISRGSIDRSSPLAHEHF